MFRYALPYDPEPDYKIVFSADHAEAFNRASMAALRVMEMDGLGNEALGVLKTSKAYMAGKMDFKTNIITDPTPVEEYGARQSSQLQERRIIIQELRSQLNGHIRVAMSELLAALQAQAVYLIFYRGGPLVIVNGPKPHDPCRIGFIRIDNAANISQEKQCVEVNRASLQSYKWLWQRLDDVRQKIAAETLAADVLDNPGAPSPAPIYRSTSTAPAETAAPIQIADMHDEEDAIDNMSESVDDEFSAPPESGDAAPEAAGGDDDSDAVFDVDMVVPF